MRFGNERSRLDVMDRRRRGRRVIRTEGPQRRAINLFKQNPQVAAAARLDHLRTKARVLHVGPADPTETSRLMLRRRFFLARPEGLD